jgi:D-alanine-D-alanine ligase
MPATRLVLLYGGRSAEHEVSCVSAMHLFGAADKARYDVSLVGVARDGRWVETSPVYERDGKALVSPDDLVGDAPAADPVRIVRSAGPSTVVFPVLHGPMGEDGTLQGLLEMAGVAYVGAGVLGSASAMDKGMAKGVLGAVGVPQARYLVVRDPQVDDSLAKSVDSELGWPVFVKPANMGSTIGVSRAADPRELKQAVRLALDYDEYVVVEEAIRGREIEIGILGWPELRVSVPGEILPSREFYDFEDKYQAGTAGLRVPADLPAAAVERIGELAVLACKSLRVDCMARVDFFFEEGGRGILLNEVNTIPGFTPISLYPQTWAAAGVPYPALIDELVSLALARHARRARFRVDR